LVNWDTQRLVWNHILTMNNIDFNSTQLIITEPMLNFASIQEGIEEVMFEDFGFDALVRIHAPTLSAYKYSREGGNDFCLIVDSGYSFTHIVPYYRGKPLLEGIRRINIGGKHITNQLKEVISYRQLMVMDETYVINQVKEELCYVSTDFEQDMKISKLKGKENTIVRDYVLPDYTNIRRGYARSQEESTGRADNSEQIIRLNNERFSVPELLFHPSDIGIKEMGIPEAIVHSIESCLTAVQPHLYNNILLTGGNVLLKGFRERVYKDLRALIPDEYDLNVFSASESQYAWYGGQLLAESGEYNNIVVTRKAYEEYGHDLCKQKFNIM